jgi:glycosyltransferase involved in cell wall biosynthesis
LTTSATTAPQLSVVVPVYNERATIEEILRRIQAVDIEKEILIVDDASTDGTREFLMDLDARIGCSTATPGCAIRGTPSDEGLSTVLSHPNSDDPLPLGPSGECGPPLAHRSEVPLVPLAGEGPGVRTASVARSHPGSDPRPPGGEGGPPPALSPAGVGRVRGSKDSAVTPYGRHHTDNVRIFFQEKNSGKGAALRRGFKEARGQIVIVQDADLEYDPQDYFALIEPIQRGQADIVYGSRFLGGPHRVLLFWHYVGNRLLTTLSNMLTDLNLSDVWTCYKAFRREVLERIDIQEDRFGFEQEITVKISKNSWRVYEVPISYFGRNYAEGKKITWKDGFRGLWCMLRYSLKT